MKTQIKHGATIETVSPEEMATMLAGLAAVSGSPDERRIRAAMVVALDATGAGQDEVYAVRSGYEFAVRRVTLDLDTAADPATGQVALNVAGRAVEYLRSGTRMEYAAPLAPTGVAQVPGVQTWGAEQGPYLSNGEVFEVKVRGLTNNARLSVTVEGGLRKMRQ